MAQVWNQDGNYWYDDAVTDASGNPLPDQLTAWLQTVSGNAKNYGKVKDYLAGLQAQGLTTADFDKALKAYGATGDSSGFLNDKNTGWWGEDAMLRALGTGVDALNPNAPYKGAWKASWNQAAENAQQKDLAEKHDANQANQGGDLDDLGDIALGFSAVLGVGALAGAFGGAAAAGATAEAGATAAAAGDAGFLTAGGVSTPATGGMFVGNSGLLGGTGNAIADAALNGAVRGGVTSALTGGDIGNGLISGGLSGGISSALPSTGSMVLDNAARGAVSGGVGAAVNGGDILTGAAAGGAAGGVGTLVRDAVGTNLGGNTLANAAAGGAAGAVGSAIAGGDVATGLIRGAVTGGTSGALQDAGVDSTVAGAVGTAAGGLINSPTPDAGTPAAQQQQTSNEINSGLGFSVVLPQFENTPRRDMQWGTRLNGG